MGHRGRMVVEFTIACAISAYHHERCKFEPRSWRGVLVIKFVSDLRQKGSFSPVSIKTDRHDIAETLLKEAINTLSKPNQTLYDKCVFNV
jgi:hypothetical protein